MSETSPTQSVQIFQLSSLKSQLKLIFTFYSSFGDRLNFTNLKSNKFHKLMSDSNITDTTFTTKQLDLLFVKQTSHQSNLSFPQFLDLLPKIAFQKYSDLDPKAAFEKLINCNFLPLYESIMNETDLGADVTQFHQEILFYPLFILEYIAPVLMKIYLAFFPWEPKSCLKKLTIQEKSETSLMKFLKEYDICPNIMTKNILETPLQNLSYNEKVKNIVYFVDKDIGTVFTFSRFCTYIIRAALIKIHVLEPSQLESEIPENSIAINQIEKLLILLNKMELSQGFMNLEKKTCNPHFSKVTLLVPKQMIDEICKEIPKSNQQANIMQNKQFIQFSPSGKTIIVKPEQTQLSHIKAPHLGDYLSSPNKNSANFGNPLQQQQQEQLTKGYFSSVDLDANLCELLDFEVSSFQILEKSLTQLLKLFQFYSSQGEPLNIYQMKSSRFVRMLKDAKLLRNQNENINFEQRENEEELPKLETLERYISQRDVDLIFTKLTGTKMQQAIKSTAISYTDIKSPNLGFFQLVNQFLISFEKPSLIGMQKGIKGKLEFEHFLKSIEMIAYRLFPEYQLQDSILHLILNYFNVLYDQNEEQIESRSIGMQYIQQLMEILNDAEMVELLGYAHKALMNFYKYYCNQKNLLSLDKFFKFCKDFQIFPEVLSKSKLQRIFCALAQMHESKLKQQKIASLQSSKASNAFQKSAVGPQQEHLLLDEHLFIEALALSAIDVQFQGEKQPSSIGKVITFLQRMNQSEGPIKIQKLLGHTRAPSGVSWDILVEIRKRFPSYFQLDQVKQILKEQQQEKFTFDKFVQSNFS